MSAVFLNVVACNAPHTHVFDQKTASDDFLKSAATEDAPAEYFYSCTCGEKGTETFSHGEVLPHTHVYDREVTDATYLKTSATTGTPAEYYHSCACGEMGTTTFFSGDVLHEYGEWEADATHVFQRCTVEGCTAVVNRSEHGLTFTEQSDGTYAVTAYAGGVANVIVPAKYENIPVTAIAAEAFAQGTDLTSLTLPSTLKRIGANAFRGCSNFKTVTISDIAAWCGIHLESINAAPTYYTKDLLLNGTPVTELVIPEGVERIENYAFYLCKSITSVTLPNSLTYIGQSAFSHSKKITALTIPESVTSISDSAFEGCTGLTTLTIPAGMTAISGSVFKDCTGLTSLTIPVGVTTISGSAFQGCTGLTSLTIPESVTTISDSAFEGCTGLTTLTIPEGVTTITNRAFRECTGLTDLNLPNSLKTIGGFDGCTGLTEITFPPFLETIEANAFAGCSGFFEITIPISVKFVGTKSFGSCANLRHFYYEGTVQEWRAISEDKWFDRSPNIYYATCIDGKARI